MRYTSATRPVESVFVPFPTFAPFTAWKREQVRTPALDRFAAPSCVVLTAPDLASYLCALRNVAGWWLTAERFA